MVKITLGGGTRVIHLNKQGKAEVVEPDTCELARRACLAFADNQGEFTMKRAIKALQKLEKEMGW